MKRGDHVRTEAHPGIACWFLRDCGLHHGCAVLRMVGDDHERHVEASSVEPIDRDDFCGECGQIGCGHG